jgi:hypothetical protein
MILFNSARESDGLIVMRLFPQLDCTLRIIGGIPFYYCYSLSSIRVIWLAVGSLSRQTKTGAFFGGPVSKTWKSRAGLINHSIFVIFDDVVEYLSIYVIHN